MFSQCQEENTSHKVRCECPECIEIKIEKELGNLSKDLATQQNE